MGALSLELPAGYYLERDSDVLILHRADGSMVAAFSALGATPGSVRQAAEEADRRQTRPEARKSPPSGTPSHPRLRVRFFERFDLARDGEEEEETIRLSCGSRAVSVLKYLLAHRSRPVSQDYLMGWLWPDSDLKRARWSLNSTIYALRKLLNGAASSASSSNHVLFEEGCYRLSPDVLVSSDVEEFDDRYERGLRFERAGWEREAVAHYEEAVELYRGDYLAEDLYEDWTMIERERLADAYVDMLDRLADHYARTGRVREGIRFHHRILEKDPCHEHSHRRLMQHYARLGLWGRALHQYRLCRKILEHTCDMAPSPETEAAYRSLFPGPAATNREFIPDSPENHRRPLDSPREQARTQRTWRDEDGERGREQSSRTPLAQRSKENGQRP